MWLLLFGLALFSGVHLVPAILHGIRAILINKLGLWPFKGLFSVLTLLSLVSIILGWRSMEPVPVYSPPPWGSHATFILVLLTFILLVSPYVKTNICRTLRHPQLIGIVLWSTGHLLANGDGRSLILFSWLALWAILEMIFIGRREGEKIKVAPVSIKYDVLAVLYGGIVYAVFLLAHPYITGTRLVSF